MTEPENQRPWEWEILQSTCAVCALNGQVGVGVRAVVNEQEINKNTLKRCHHVAAENVWLTKEAKDVGH